MLIFVIFNPQVKIVAFLGCSFVHSVEDQSVSVAVRLVEVSSQSNAGPAALTKSIAKSVLATIVEFPSCLSYDWYRNSQLLPITKVKSHHPSKAYMVVFAEFSWLFHKATVGRRDFERVVWSDLNVINKPENTAIHLIFLAPRG